MRIYMGNFYTEILLYRSCGKYSGGGGSGVGRKLYITMENTLRVREVEPQPRETGASVAGHTPIERSSSTDPYPWAHSP